MAVYECMCGFSTPSASTFTRHLSRFRDSTEHYMVPIDKPRPPRAVEQTEGGGERGTDDALRPEGSLLDERACSVPEVRLDTAQTRELPKVKSGKSRAPKMATPPETDVAEEGELLAAVLPERTITLYNDLRDRSYDCITAMDSPCASEEVDAAWEAVPSFVCEDDEYVQLTRRVEAMSSPSPEPSGDWGLGGMLSRTVDRLRTSWVFSTPLQGHPAGRSLDHDFRSLEEATPDVIDNILLWSDPWMSTKVFVGGLYVLYCIRQVLHGVFILQPTTVLAGLPFTVLMYHLALRVLAAHLHLLPGWCQAGPPRWLPGLASLQADGSKGFEEGCMQAVVGLMTRATQVVAPWVAATVTCFARRLRGHHVGASVWLALLLWTTMCLGELGIMHQSALIFVLWTMLFSLPVLYVASKRVLDALIEESFRFIISAANGGGRERSTLLMAGGAFLVTALAMEGSFLLQFSSAAIAALAVFVWRVSV